MRKARYSKSFFMSIFCILLVVAVSVTMLLGASSPKQSANSEISQTEESADSVLAAYPVSADGYTHGSNIGRSGVTGTEVTNASDFISAISGNKSINLQNDITLSSSQAFTATNTYSATIYGNGHTITLDPNSNKTTSSSAVNKGGLVSTLSGKIYDLNVKIADKGSSNFILSQGSKADPSTANIGIIAGYINGGTVENCSVSIGTGIIWVYGWRESNWASFGAIAGRAYNATVKNCTVINNASVNAGAASDTNVNSIKTSSAGGTSSNCIGYYEGSAFTIDNIIVSGSGSLNSFYASNLGMTSSESTNVTTTNFYNRFTGNIVSTNNGGSLQYVRYIESGMFGSVTPKGTVSITNMYTYSDVKSVSNDHNISPTNSLQINKALIYSIYFDPQATDISNSLVVTQSNVSGGADKKASITTYNNKTYSDYAFSADGNTVIMRNLPTATSYWNNNGNFSCTITISDKYVSNPQISGSYTYNGAPIDVTVGMTYNGSKYSNYTITYEAKADGAELSAGKPYSAGTYNVIVKLGGEDIFSNNTNTYQIELNVEKKTILDPQMTLTDNIYNGQTKTPVFTSTNVGSEAVDIVYEGSQVNAGTFTAIVTPNKNHKFEDDSANKSYEFIIQQKEVTVTAENKEKHYGDSNPEFTYQITKGQIYENYSVVFSCDANELSDAGTTYEIVPNIENLATIDNYNITYQNGSLTINKKQVQITVNPEASATAEFSGVWTNSQLASLFVRPKDLNNQPLLLAFEIMLVQEETSIPATVQYVGTYEITATIMESYTEEEQTIYQTNYTAEPCKFTLTIKGKPISVVVDDTKPATKQYDGIAVTAEELRSLFIVKDAVDEGNYPDIIVTSREGEIKNAGTYRIDVALPEDYAKMYEIEAFEQETTYTVTPVEVNGTVTAPENCVYDGNIKEAIFSFSNGAMIGNDEVLFSYSTQAGQSIDNIISAGNYSAIASLPTYTDGKSNYVWAEDAVVQADFTISPAEVDVVWSNTSLVYNKTAQMPTAVATGIGDDIINVIVSVNEGEAITVGNYNATATTDNGNYTLKNSETTFEIVRAELANLTVSLDGWIYGEDANHISINGNEENGAVTYMYESTDGASYSSDKMPTQAGAYKLTITVAETANYNQAVASTTFEISKAILTDNTQAVSAMYNGKAHGLVFDLSGFKYGDNFENAGKVVKYGSAEGVYDTVEITVTDVNEDALNVYYQITFDNYNTIEGSNTIIVTPKDITIEGVTAVGREYDGTTNVKLSEGNLVGVVDGDNVTFVLGNGTAESADAGQNIKVTTAITLDGEDKGNYNLASQPEVVVEISQKTVVIERNELAETTRTYDKNIITNDFSGLFIAPKTIGGVDDLALEYTVTINGETVVDGIKNAGTYTVRAELSDKAGNYRAEACEVVYTVTKADPVVEVTVTIPEGGLFTSDKMPEISVQSSDTPGTVAWIEGQELIEGENSYDWIFQPTDNANYNDLSGSYILEVTSVNVEKIEITQLPNKTVYIYGDLFDATGMVVTASYENGKQREVEGYDVDITQFKTVGDDVAVTVSYQGCIATFNVEVQKKTISVMGATAVDREYDGTTVVSVNKGQLVGVLDGDDVVLNIVSGTVADKNVGANKAVEVVANISGSDADKYILSQISGVTVNISAKSVDVIWDNTRFTYDGEEHKPTATVQTGVDGENIQLTVSGAKVNAGTYSATAQMTVADNNYILKNSNIKFVIDRAVSIIDVDGVKTQYVYNGQLQTVNGGATLNHSESQLVYTNNTFTTVAEGDGLVVTISVAESENYLSASQTVTISVSKADYNMAGVVFEDKTVTYNGSVQNIAVQGTLPEGVSVSYSDGGKNVGEYTITATFSGDSANYNAIADMTATLTITKATYDMSGVEFKDVTTVEDGTAKSIAISGNLPQGVSVEYSGNGQSKAGVYTVTATFNGDSENYNAIEPMTATLTVNQAELAYTGENQQSPDVIVSADGGIEPGLQLVVEKKDATQFEGKIDENASVSAVYDLSLQKDGVVVEMNGNVTVRLMIPSEIKDKDFKVYGLNGNNSQQIQFTVDGDYVVFTTDNLDQFAFVVPEESGSALWLIIALAAIVLIEIVIIAIKKSKNKKKSNAYMAGIFGGAIATYETVLIIVLGALAVILAIYIIYLFASKKEQKVAQEEKTEDAVCEESALPEQSETQENIEDVAEVVCDTANESVEEFEIVQEIAQCEECAEEVVQEETSLNEEQQTIEVAEIAEEMPVEQADTVEEVEAEEVKAEEVKAEEVEQAQQDLSVDQMVAIQVEDNQSLQLDDEDNDDEVVASEDDSVVKVRFNRSFTAKIILSDDAVKNYFAEVANYILSYKKVKSRMSWKSLTFNKGRKILAKLGIRGKTLWLFTALEPAEFTESKYFGEDFSESAQYEKVPYGVKVKSNRGVKFAKELIDILMQRSEIEKDKDCDAFKAEDYPYDTQENLIERGLIKYYADGEVEEGAQLVSASFDIREKVTVSEAHSLISDSQALELLETQSQSDDEYVVSGEEKKNGKKEIVNIDTLSENFNAGETVDIEALKEKKLVPKNTVAIKVLARGTLNKPLKVIADDFSADAIKMIVLTGGKAISCA